MWEGGGVSQWLNVRLERETCIFLRLQSLICVVVYLLTIRQLKIYPWICCLCKFVGAIEVKLQVSIDTFDKLGYVPVFVSPEFHERRIDVLRCTILNIRVFVNLLVISLNDITWSLLVPTKEEQMSRMGNKYLPIFSSYLL